MGGIRNPVATRDADPKAANSSAARNLSLIELVATLRQDACVAVSDGVGTIAFSAWDALDFGREPHTVGGLAGSLLCTAERASWLGAGECAPPGSPWLNEAGRWTAAPRPAFGAALALLKRAGLLPMAIVSAPIAHEFGKAIPADTVLEQLKAAPRLRRVAEAPVPLKIDPSVSIRAYRPDDGGREHLLICVGRPFDQPAPLLRLHSECFTGDLLGSLRCDCGGQLHGALERLSAEGGGLLVYLAQEGRGIGLVNKLRAYRLQDRGLDTVDANLCLGYLADERDFRPAVAILRDCNVSAVRLLSNNPAKASALRADGITVVERLPLRVPATPQSARYLATKASRFGHDLG